VKDKSRRHHGAEALLPLEDYFQTRHGLILAEELTSAVVQDSV
jgi:hypothetical protein